MLNIAELRMQLWLKRQRDKQSYNTTIAVRTLAFDHESCVGKAQLCHKKRCILHPRLMVNGQHTHCGHSVIALFVPGSQPRQAVMPMWPTNTPQNDQQT